jgi:outer membrane protein
MNAKLCSAAAVLLAATACTPALAQNFFTGPTGYESGDILVHAGVVGVFPQNLGSAVTVTGAGTVPGLHVHASSGVSPELDGSYFITPHISLELIAATSKHNTWVQGGGVSKIKVGSVWVLPPTLTAQYHFAQFGYVRPYVGVGLTVAFFYGTSPAAGVSSTSYSTAVGPALDAGFDVPVGGNWSVNFDLKQMFINTAAHVDHGAFATAHTELDPTVIRVGIGYKF